MALKKGDKVVMTETSIDNYGERFRGKEFEILKVYTSKEEHPGYDEGLAGVELYDFVGIDYSLYEFEVEKV